MAVLTAPLTLLKARSCQVRCCHPIHVTQERISADGVVEPAGRVGEQRERAASGVVLTGGVGEKRSRSQRPFVHPRCCLAVRQRRHQC